jgi:hypothetical protein
LELAHKIVLRVVFDTASTSSPGAHGFICICGDVLAILEDTLAVALDERQS